VSDAAAIPPCLRDHSDGFDHDLTENIHTFDFHVTRNHIARAACAKAVRHYLDPH
jgi:hypothetical protein